MTYALEGRALEFKRQAERVLQLLTPKFNETMTERQVSYQFTLRGIAKRSASLRKRCHLPNSNGKS